MIKKLLVLLLLAPGLLLHGQECPSPVLTSPADGDLNVAVDTEISWNGVPGVPAYLLSIGTTPFGTEILNRQNVGTATSYIPPMGLPANEDIYVTITLFFFQAGMSEIECNTETFRTAVETSPPSCTTLSSPLNGMSNINVGANLNWNYAPGATSYDLRIGTTPGGEEIRPNSDVGNTLSYNPPGDLPPNTPIYVLVTPRNSLGAPLTGCSEDMFTTGTIASLPDCSVLITPADGATNVELSPLLEWNPVPGAVGYRVTIGQSPYTAEILNNVNFTNTSSNFIEFEPNRTFFVRIVPYNDAGAAIECQQTSFSTLLGCGPFYDNSGNLVRINPEIDFPSIVSFCENEGSLTVTTTDVADGYRWFTVDEFGNESFLGDGESVELNATGLYRYEAYNLADQAGSDVECSSTRLFEVVSSQVATINALRVTGGGGNLRIEAQVSGNGDYEFALDSSEGPYQDSPVFNGIPPGNHTVYVRDKNGCGIVSESIEQQLALDGFPSFFTPNGDGINDFWQYVPPITIEEIPLSLIQVYDRYGKLLASFTPNSAGWDGTFGGQPLPADDYWFRAEVEAQEALQGHFTLKR